MGGLVEIGILFTEGIMNKIIIINGPSCAGKTTIAQEICRQSDNQFVHLQIDEAKKYLFTILDSKSTPREIGRPICDEILLQTAQIFLSNGKNIVIDTTFDGDDRENVMVTAKHYIAFFKNAEVLFVGINCPVEERLRRFKENNNNPVRNERTIIAQSNVFELCKEFYDIWFDSSLLNSGEIASNILQHIQHPQKIHETILVRPSTLADIDIIVLLSKAKRLAYEKAQPQFWKYAGDTAEISQAEWFKALLTHYDHVMLTAICHEQIVGFIIGKLIPAPEVYDLGGLTLMIDDFCFEDKAGWYEIGCKLIQEIKTISKMKEAKQILVVCGAHDEPKHSFLKSIGLTVASEWYVGGIA